MNAHLLPHPYNQSLKKPHFSALSKYAGLLLDLCIRTSPTTLLERRSPPISVICISDTHNATPLVPDGDILIHAGDLTQHGTFDELQAQLSWLRSLPHQYKMVIAGNHDVLLDEVFIEKFPHRASGEPGKGRQELDWGNLIYLNDSSVTLEFPNHRGRKLKVFGSPKTPEFGTWAFQYPAIRDVWTHRIPEDANIVVTHGPPLLHGDVDKKGDGYLLRELRRVKPEVFVCGHMHDGHGLYFMRHNGIEGLAEEIELGWSGISALLRMGTMLLYSRLKLLGGHKPWKGTTVVNAAIAPSEKRKTPKNAIKTWI